MTTVAVRFVASSVVTATVRGAITNRQQQCAQTPGDGPGGVFLCVLFKFARADWCRLLTGSCQQLQVLHVKRLITQPPGPFCPAIHAAANHVLDAC